MAEHDELDKLEHELHKVEFNRPYDIVEIRKLKGKIQDLKNQYKTMNIYNNMSMLINFIILK